MRPTIHILLFSLLAAAVPCGAEASDANRPAPSPMTREVPEPERDWNLIARLGVAARIDPGQQNYYPRSAAHGTLQLGAQRNTSAMTSWGGNMYLGADDQRTRVGLQARFTHWFGRNTSLGLAPGVLFAGGDEWDGSATYPGFVGDAALSFHGWIHLTATVESVEITHAALPNVRDTSWYLGASGTGPRGALLLAGCGLAILAVQGIAYYSQ